MAAKGKGSARGTFTHVEKVFFPEGKFTKGDLIRYYIEVSRFMVPHLRNRPITLIRFPDGVNGEKFYEKNAPSYAPDWIKTFDVPRQHEPGRIRYVLINDADTLAWCANQGAIEIHPFLHRVPRIAEPTFVAFDLDPGEGSDIRTCARVALLVRKVLETLGLKAFPKLSGSKGLQLYVPLNTRSSYAATGAFAKAVAEYLEQSHSDLVVSNMAKTRRLKRVLIDWSQNSASKTTVGVYSVRGKNQAPYVSVPVSWEEVERAAKSRTAALGPFGPGQALKRLRKLGDLFAPVLTLKQRLPKSFSALPAPTDPLRRYDEKRDFTKTREPEPARISQPRGSAKGRFVIQKHAASHLHYDFRLEMDGTLKSWAVPKGLSTELGVKRTAIHVEDHPISYMKFEGTIPKGQYGGGTVMVWDIGTFRLLGGSVGAGNLKFVLEGKKLRGEWHMFRIRTEAGKDIWLITKSKVAAKPIGPRQEDSSALTRRSMARIAKDNDAQWDSSR